MIRTIMVPDSKVHGANIGSIWGQEDPGAPHVGPMNFAIWGRVQNKGHVFRWKNADQHLVIIVFYTSRNEPVKRGKQLFLSSSIVYNFINT